LLWANTRGFIGLAPSFIGIEGEASLGAIALGIISPPLVFYVFGFLRSLTE
jgi:hypothetical protein